MDNLTLYVGMLSPGSETVLQIRRAHWLWGSLLHG